MSIEIDKDKRENNKKKKTKKREPKETRWTYEPVEEPKATRKKIASGTLMELRPRVRKPPDRLNN